MAEFIASSVSDSALLGCVLRRLGSKLTLGEGETAQGVGFFQNDDVLVRKHPATASVTPERLAEGLDSDIAILTYPDDVADQYFWAKSMEAAQRIGIKAIKFEATSPAGIEKSFVEMRRSGAGAVVVMTEAYFVSQIPQLVSLANQHRLPAIFGYREFVQAGGMMSYGLSYKEYYKRVARYIDAVIKGARPADLPVEQPTKIELAINLRTAQALGVTIPQTLLLRADEVIQ